MIYRIYGQKDSTIYEQSARKTQNTGKDEILEVTKFFDELTNTKWIGNSRILTQFNLTPISQSIVDGDISGSTKYYLNLTSTEETEAQAEYDLNVYLVSQSWTAGLGQFNDNPKATSGVSWEHRDTGTLWNVTSPQVFNGTRQTQVPTKGIILYEGFTNGTGSAFLTESINDISGNKPSAFVNNNTLFISASNYAGTTLVFPTYLSQSVSYGIQFQVNPGDFNDIAFRIKDPNGVLKTEEDYENMVGKITSPSTQSFVVSAEATGTHELRFTFFDGEVSGTTTSGSMDEIYVYQLTGNNLVWETFTLNQGGFVLRNVVKETPSSQVRMFASQSKLNLYSDDGGGDASYIYNLTSGSTYHISSSISVGDYPSIDFTVYDPNGLKTREGISNLTSSYTSNATQAITFTPTFTGNHIFAYTYYNSASSAASASIDDFKIGISGSLQAAPITEAGWYKNSGGGSWYTASLGNTSYSQTFTKYNKNLNVDVTEYVNDWVGGLRPNNGFIIKRPAAQESGSVKYGSSKFFSNNTHTIYVPTLEVRWDDSSFSTGSLDELTADDITLYIKNLNSEYKELSKARIRVVGRETYPQRSFADSNPYTTIKHLPQTTYYQVRDVDTNQVLIPYDTSHTKVSCDSTGNYFNFWFNTLQPERYYQFEFRVDRAGKKQYFDGFIFKVVR
jgi:hypothetical protein